MTLQTICTNKMSIYSNAEVHNLLKMLGNLQDAILNAQRELSEQNNFLKSIILSEPDCVCVITLNGHLLEMNPAGLAMLEVDSLEDISNQGLNSFIVPEFIDEFNDLLKNVIAGASGVMEFPIQARKGTLRWLEIHANAWRHTNGEITGIIGLIRDITELRKLRHDLEQQARIDYLTGLANRRHFMEKASIELARVSRYNSQLSLIIMDIDHFKIINDTYGHQTGDKVLEKLSEVCRHALREADIIGRIGGEEFAILLPETPTLQAYESAERLRELIAAAEVYVENGTPFHFTISIGISNTANNILKLDQLLHMADLALYEAKKERNKVCVAPM